MCLTDVCVCVCVCLCDDYEDQEVCSVAQWCLCEVWCCSKLTVAIFRLCPPPLPLSPLSPPPLSPLSPLSPSLPLSLTVARRLADGTVSYGDQKGEMTEEMMELEMG